MDWLGGNRIRLLLTSGTLLFVELLLIRWIPANVTYVGFFRNFLLMASFLGIGVGILYGRARRGFALSPFPVLLLALVAFIGPATINIELQTPNEIFFGLTDRVGG